MHATRKKQRESRAWEEASVLKGVISELEDRAKMEEWSRIPDAKTKMHAPEDVWAKMFASRGFGPLQDVVSQDDMLRMKSVDIRLPGVTNRGDLHRELLQALREAVPQVSSPPTLEQLMNGTIVPIPEEQRSPSASSDSDYIMIDMPIVPQALPLVSSSWA